MQTTINPLLFSLLKTTPLNNERVMEIILSVVNNYTDEFLRIMAYLTDTTDTPLISDTNNTDNHEYIYDSYDFIKDRVSYHGKYIETRYVESEALAAQLKGTEVEKLPGSYYKSDTNPYETQVWYTKNGAYMSRESWEKGGN